jgi:nucleotide-binding universal stress UspA family protein
MPQTLIVSTDFSPAAENALHYACRLAEASGAAVRVLHTYVVPVSFSDMPMPMVPADDVRTIAEERMEKLQQELTEQYRGIQVLTEARYGELSDWLRDEAEEHRTALNPGGDTLLVLANTGAADSLAWLDDNTLSSLRNAPYPALAVPAAQGFAAPRRLCLACDFRTAHEKLPVDAISGIVRWLGAELHLLHVSTAGEPHAAAEEADICRLLAALSPQCHIVGGENVDSAIQAFVAAEGIDWLLLVPHHHSFFEGLFHHSHTKAMVQQSAIPLLALPERQA